MEMYFWNLFGLFSLYYILSKAMARPVLRYHTWFMQASLCVPFDHVFVSVRCIRVCLFFHPVCFVREQTPPPFWAYAPHFSPGCEKCWDYRRLAFLFRGTFLMEFHFLFFWCYWRVLLCSFRESWPPLIMTQNPTMTYSAHAQLWPCCVQNHILIRTSSFLPIGSPLSPNIKPVHELPPSFLLAVGSATSLTETPKFRVFLCCSVMARNSTGACLHIWLCSFLSAGILHCFLIIGNPQSWPLGNSSPAVSPPIIYIFS